VRVPFVLEPLFCVIIVKQRDSENKRYVHIIIYVCVVLYFIISALICVCSSERLHKTGFVHILCRL